MTTNEPQAGENQATPPAGASQTPSNATPPAGGGSSTTTGAPTPDDLSHLPKDARERVEREVKDRQRANAEAKKANAENAELRTKLEALEKAEAERKKSEMSDLEKAKAEAEELREAAAKAQETARQANIRVVASKLGFADPDDAPRFVASDVKDEAIEAALKEILEKKPYLKGQQQGGMPHTGGAKPPLADGDVEKAKKQVLADFPALREFKQ